MRVLSALLVLLGAMCSSVDAASVTTVHVVAKPAKILVSVFNPLTLLFTNTSTATLATAQYYGLSASTTITATPAVKSVINGGLALFPGTAVTGSPSVSGDYDVADAFADQAGLDYGVYRTSLLALPSTQPLLASANLGGVTLQSGVWRFQGAFPDATLTGGALTFDAQGNPNAAFVVIIAASFTVGNTVTGGTVTLINGANYCNIFFVVGSFATLYPNTAFQGSLLVWTSAALQTGATLNGYIWAATAAITLQQNTINSAVCQSGPAPTHPVILSGNTNPPTIQSSGASSTVASAALPIALFVLAAAAQLAR
jgi:hypothetical protein